MSVAAERASQASKYAQFPGFPQVEQRGMVPEDIIRSLTAPGRFVPWIICSATMIGKLDTTVFDAEKDCFQDNRLRVCLLPHFLSFLIGPIGRL
jgi:hypothetical protein